MRITRKSLTVLSNCVVETINKAYWLETFDMSVFTIHCVMCIYMRLCSFAIEMILFAGRNILYLFWFFFWIQWKQKNNKKLVFPFSFSIYLVVNASCKCKLPFFPSLPNLNFCCCCCCCFLWKLFYFSLLLMIIPKYKHSFTLNAERSSYNADIC